MCLSRHLAPAATMIFGSVWLLTTHALLPAHGAEVFPEDHCALMQLYHNVRSRTFEPFKACDEVVPVTGSQKPMPAVGFGTCCRDAAIGPPLIESTKIYLASGGRLIDTAESYGNQPDLAVAIQESGIPREDIWITSKVKVREKHNFSDVIKSVDDSLKDLDVDYIDLMLLHGPAEPRTEFFSALLAAKAAGKIRNAGVSNFNQTQLEELVNVTGEAPAVNQIEFHPWVTEWTKDLVKWMHERGIAVTAYDVLGSGSMSTAQSDAVAALAAKYHVTDAQVLIRWALDKGVAPLFGATSQEHIQEDLNCSGLQHLSAEDTVYLESSERPDTWTEFNGETVPH
mmetsp:Transcript_82213/g.150427  ORF Transcript_82213/g.150427 Transcript_82213/m.150427 type:complete len:341 (-) Transcript_82213:195-1217(-)